MTIFVDTSAWYALVDRGDTEHARAKAVLHGTELLVTTDYILVESWLLLNSRLDRKTANTFWRSLREGIAELEHVEPADIEQAWHVGERFSDQGFSVVDCTSFVVMERLGLSRAASFDSDFAIYRYGRRREKAFEILR